MGNTLVSPFRPSVESPVKLTHSEYCAPSARSSGADDRRQVAQQHNGANWVNPELSPPFRRLRNKCAERRLR